MQSLNFAKNIERKEEKIREGVAEGVVKTELPEGTLLQLGCPNNQLLFLVKVLAVVDELCDLCVWLRKTTTDIVKPTCHFMMADQLGVCV